MELSNNTPSASTLIVIDPVTNAHRNLNYILTFVCGSDKYKSIKSIFAISNLP